MKYLMYGAALLASVAASQAYSADEVKLLGARSQQCFTSGCFFDPNLTGEIQVQNIAYQKQVDVVYDSYSQTEWLAASANYQGPASSGFEIWDFQVFGNVEAFALSYEVNGLQYWDNNNGADYDSSFGSGIITVLGEGVDVLVGEKLQFNEAGYDTENDRVLVYIWARNVGGTARNVSITYTDDAWSTVKVASAGAIHNQGGNGITMYSAILPIAENASAQDIEFAAEASINGQSSWDNNFGRNYKIDANGNIVR